jgi:hypothetical protein
VNLNVSYSGLKEGIALNKFRSWDAIRQLKETYRTAAQRLAGTKMEAIASLNALITALRQNSKRMTYVVIFLELSTY